MKHAQGSKQTWYAVTLHVPMAHTDLATSLLAEQGTTGIIETPLDEHTVSYTAYFTNESSLNFVRSAFQETVIVSITPVDYDPSHEAWKQHFCTHEIVPGILIAPSWEKIANADRHNVILLDPGMAFGTGLHETTQLCANALYRLQLHETGPQSLLDVGCGSGILSLIGKHLGYRPIAAVDIDDIAREVADENFRINDATGIRLVTGISALQEKKFAVIVANILLSPLIDMHQALLDHLVQKGKLVLSGITLDQQDELIEHYTSHGCELLARNSAQEWCCITLQKSSV